MRSPLALGTIEYLRTALAFSACTIVLLGFAYPLAVTGVVQVLMPAQANGSLVSGRAGVVGSGIVGQLFTKPQYFHGRPSAAGKNGYDPTATGATNLGPASKALRDATRSAIAALRKANPDATDPVPMDLVTSSGSGIDPDISPEAAYYQVPRVAHARAMSADTVRAIVAAHVHQRELGFLGEPRVNVLQLNMALDASGS